MAFDSRPRGLGKLAYHLRYLVNPRFRRLVERPVFIVGCGHSGTTLLLRIIGAHPHIHPILNETYCFVDGPWRRIRSFDMEAYRSGARRWVEKTPAHIRHLERIFARRPKARVLLLLRDGRDVAASIAKRTGDICYGARRWVQDNRLGKRWWDDPRVMLVRYEDLVTRFEEETRRIFAFLGEELSRDPRDFRSKFALVREEQRPPDSSEVNHVAYRRWQVSQPLFDGRGRWKALTAEERALVKREAGPLLREFGYADSDDW